MSVRCKKLQKFTAQTALKFDKKQGSSSKLLAPPKRGADRKTLYGLQVKKTRRCPGYTKQELVASDGNVGHPVCLSSDAEGWPFTMPMARVCNVISGPAKLAVFF